MNVLGLDGKTHKLRLINQKRKDVSKLHLRVREILKRLYPFDLVFEEVTLSGTKTAKHKGLRTDFFIPNQRIMIEVHGQQHYEFTPFYHKNKLDFALSRKRDSDKALWCSFNKIAYVELKYDQSDDEWTRLITTAHGT
jgi:hypothetical protein